MRGHLAVARGEQGARPRTVASTRTLTLTLTLTRTRTLTLTLTLTRTLPPRLTKAGDTYARRLGVFTDECIQTNCRTGKNVAARLWTSSLKRTEQTAAYIAHPDLEVRGLTLTLTLTLTPTLTLALTLTLATEGPPMRISPRRMPPLSGSSLSELR